MRRKGCLKDRVLMIITKVVAVLFILAVCAIDSSSYLPMTMCFMCEIWFGLMIAANGRGVSILKHKQPQNPTRAQKEIIKNNGLDWRNWLVPHGGEDNISLVVISKKSGRRKVLFK